MISNAFLMDKMGNDSEGIVVLMGILLSIVLVVWLARVLTRFIRRRTRL